MPSKPIFTSTGVTPAVLQASSSVSLMRREALVMSGVLSPTPSQKSLMPPPVPVDSTTGAREAAFLGEALGDRSGEGEHGGGADDLNLLLRATATPLSAGDGNGERRGGGEESAGHGGSPCLWGIGGGIGWSAVDSLTVAPDVPMTFS